MESRFAGNPPAPAESSAIYSISVPASKPKPRPLIKAKVTADSLVLRAPINADLFSTTAVPGKKTVPPVAPAQNGKPHHSHQKRPGNW